MIAKWHKVKAAQATVKADNHECFIIRFDLTDHKFTFAERRRESQKTARLAYISSAPSVQPPHQKQFPSEVKTLAV